MEDKEEQNKSKKNTFAVLYIILSILLVVILVLSIYNYRAVKVLPLVDLNKTTENITNNSITGIEAGADILIENTTEKNTTELLNSTELLIESIN